MLIYLKDIDKQEIIGHLTNLFREEAIEVIISDSDHSADRSEVLRKLKENRRNVHVLCTYDVDYLKWSYAYYCMVFVTARDRAFVVDSLGQCRRITLVKLLYWGLCAVAAFCVQLYHSVSYKFALRKLRRFPRFLLAKQGLSAKNKDLVYLRATDTFNLRGGGSLGHTVGMVEAFENYGAQVTFLGIDNLWGLSVSEKIIVKPSVFHNYINIFGRFAYNKRLISRAVEVMASGKFRYIYQRASRDNYTGVALSRRFGIPLVLEFNSFLSWELDGANHWLHRLFTGATGEIERFNLSQADIILVVSDALKCQLIDFGYNADKILVAPNGVDVDRFTPNLPSSIDRAKIGIPSKTIIFGFSGTFGFWHGIDTLVKSILEIVKTRDDVCFLLMGDGPGRAGAQKALSAYSNVIFTGLLPYNDMPHYLNMCDVLLSPHMVPKGEKFIGSPTKLYEYMACGKIIIASDLDQISDVISPSRSVLKSDNGFLMSEASSDQLGITVPPGSSKALSFAINSVANDPQYFKVLGKNSRERAVRKHGWGSVVKLINEKICLLES